VSGIILSETRHVTAGNGFGYTSVAAKKALVANETLTMDATDFGSGGYNHTGCRIFIRRVN